MALTLPRPWKNPGALLGAIAAVVVATVTTLAWAGSQVKAVAASEAAAKVAPVESELREHKAAEDVRHEYEDQHIKHIEEMLDRLLAR